MTRRRDSNGYLYAASAETGISMDDYKRMQTHGRGGFRPWAPPFAFNDKQLQRLLLVRAWRYVHGPNSKVIPEDINRAEINKLATAKALKGHVIRPDAPAIHHEALRRHQAAVRRAGGFLEWQAAIAFRSWRLGNPSTEVAASLDMTPWTVRQSLWRLRHVAKILGYEVGRAGHTAGTKRNKKTGHECPASEAA